MSTNERKTEIKEVSAPQQSAGASGHGAEIAFASIFRSEPKTLVQIPEGEGEAGRLGVKLSIQGHMVMVPRGKTVALPESYVKLLSDLVVGETNGDGSDSWQRPRFNYSLLGPAPAKAAVAA